MSTTHGIIKPEEFHEPTLDWLTRLNHSFMGGGMSQTFSAIMFLEYYIRLHQFDYVVELGTQKGALSLYLANLACVTEQFFFETYDIDDYFLCNRQENGTWHWLKQITNISSRVKFYKLDVFNQETFDYISYSLSKSAKTLILADNGNKPRELSMYGPLLRINDRIMAHDWDNNDGSAEIRPQDVDMKILNFDQPYHDYSQTLRTKWAVFRKA